MTEQSQTTPARHQTASWIVLTLDVIGLTFLLYCLIYVEDKFRQIFADLLEGRSLPVLTHAVLSIPRTVSLLFFIGAVTALIYKETHIPNRTRTLVMNIVVFVVAVFCFMVFAIAMFIPLVDIVASLKE